MTALNVSDGIAVFSIRVQGVASTTLDILRAVDLTVDSLSKEQRLISDLVGLCESFVERIAGLEATKVGNEDKLVSQLEKAEEIAKDVLSGHGGRRQSAIRDPRLQGDHEETVVTEYERLMEHYEALIGCMSELRWAVLEHNADLETPEGEPFDSAEDMIADLRR